MTVMMVAGFGVMMRKSKSM